MCRRFLMCTGSRLSTRLLSTKKRIISGHRGIHGKGLELWRGRGRGQSYTRRISWWETFRLRLIGVKTLRSLRFALAYFTSFVATQVLQSHLQAVTPPQDRPLSLTTNERSSMRGITNCQQNCDGEGERDESSGGTGG